MSCFQCYEGSSGAAHANGTGVMAASGRSYREPLSDTELVIRCQYCFSGCDFKPMLAYKDARFVCIWCAHTLHLSESRSSCQPERENRAHCRAKISLASGDLRDCGAGQAH